MPNILDNEMYTVLDPLLTRSGRKTLRPCMKNAKNAEKPHFLPNRVSFRPKIDKIIIYDLSGRKPYNKAYNNEAIDVGFLKTSHYILSLRGKTSSEFLKFSIIK